MNCLHVKWGTATSEDPSEIVAINREFHPSRIFRTYGAGGASRGQMIPQLSFVISEMRDVLNKAVKEGDVQSRA